MNDSTPAAVKGKVRRLYVHDMDGLFLYQYLAVSVPVILTLAGCVFDQWCRPYIIYVWVVYAAVALAICWKEMWITQPVTAETAGRIRDEYHRVMNPDSMSMEAHRMIKIRSEIDIATQVVDAYRLLNEKYTTTLCRKYAITADTLKSIVDGTFVPVEPDSRLVQTTADDKRTSKTAQTKKVDWATLLAKQIDQEGGPVQPLSNRDIALKFGDYEEFTNWVLQQSQTRGQLRREAQEALLSSARNAISVIRNEMADNGRSSSEFRAAVEGMIGNATRLSEDFVGVTIANSQQTLRLVLTPSSCDILREELGETSGSPMKHSDEEGTTGKRVTMDKAAVAAFVKRRWADIPRDIHIPFEHYWQIFNNGQQLNASSRDQLPEDIRDDAPMTLAELVAAYDYEWSQGARSGINILVLGTEFRILQVNMGPWQSDIYRVSEAGYVCHNEANE